MPAQLQGLVASIRRLFAGFTTGQKVMTGLAVFAVAVGAFLFMSWAAKPSYAPLFTNLEAADAAAVTEQLAARGTGYQLADGGRTVMVPRSELYQLRLDLSAAGLPSGGTQGYALLDEQGITASEFRQRVDYQLADGGRTVMVPQSELYQLRLDLSAAGLPSGGTQGYALLDEQGITASEFRQRVDYQRAIEGELTRTISSIDGVDAATVHLVMPEEDLFSDDERKPTASVLIKTRPGKDLAPGQVQAIVHLVSSSVEGLAPEQITVADAKGTMLAAPGEDGLTAAANDARAQQTAAFEQDLSRSVQQLLEPVAGAGGAIVRVRADLDFDQRSTRTERYEAAEGLPPATEATTRETYTGMGAPVGGVLGPDGLPVAPGAGESTYEKEQSQVANALGTVTEEVKSAPGQVRRMSVAVLLDGNAGPVNEDAVRNLVAAATLFDPERGDEIEVTTMAFDTTAAEAAAEELAAAEAAERRSELMQLARTVAIALVIALALFLAYRSSRKQRREPITLTEAFALQAGDDFLDLDSDEDDLARLGAGTGRALEPADARRLEVQNEVAELVDRQPEEVAQLLRGWMADRRGA